MSRKQFLIMLVVMSVFGVIGGFLSNRLLSERIASAAEMGFTTGEQVDFSSAFRTQKIELIDSSGKVRASLGVTDNGLPALIFFDKDNTVSAVLGLTNEYCPALILQGKGGSKINLSLGADGSSSLALLDK